MHPKRPNSDFSPPSQNPPASPPEHPESLPRRSPKTMIVAVSVAAVLALAYALYASFFAPPKEPLIAEGVRVRAIQMDVLNAAGGNRLAQRATEFLRERGFDVVEMGNALAREQDHTLIIDRIGNMNVARQVAEALGVPEQQIVQRIDPTLYLDVTVMIGKDFQSLKPWR